MESRGRRGYYLRKAALTLAILGVCLIIVLGSEYLSLDADMPHPNRQPHPVEPEPSSPVPHPETRTVCVEVPINDTPRTPAKQNRCGENHIC